MQCIVCSCCCCELLSAEFCVLSLQSLSCWHVWVLPETITLCVIGESCWERSELLRGEWRLWACWHSVFASAGVGALGSREAEIGLCPSVAVVRCPVCFYSVCTDVHTRLLVGTAVLQLGRIFSSRSSQMLSLQSFCGLLRAPRQAAIKAQLSFVSAFEALVIHLSSQIPACTLGKAFPRGSKALEGREEFEEVNLMPVNPLFTLLFFSWGFITAFYHSPITSDAVCKRRGPTPHPWRLFCAVEGSEWGIRWGLRAEHSHQFLTVGIRRITAKKAKKNSGILATGKLPTYTERSHHSITFRDLGRSLMQKIDFFPLLQLGILALSFCVLECSSYRQNVPSGVWMMRTNRKGACITAEPCPCSSLHTAVIEMQHEVLICSFLFSSIFHICNLLKFKDCK